MSEDKKEKEFAIDIEGMAQFCKMKGIVYPNSEIYGGMSGFWDFGPLGSNLKMNLKGEWWKTFVVEREDMAGIDGSIITHPKVWEASGHVSSFVDIIVACTKCGATMRGDHLVEDELDIAADGIDKAGVKTLIEKNGIKCKKCSGELGEPSDYNLMFKTKVGPVDDTASIAYLRPETAQLMFTNFRLVQENARLKLPFGIAQMGRAFRNEISPRDFIFRCREFEQMEIEYFIHPKDINNCPFIDKNVLDMKVLVLSAEMQEKEQEPVHWLLEELLDKGVMKSSWHAYWISIVLRWFERLGANPENFRIRQHGADEMSHYSCDTWDIEYHFPFGWKELQGFANRTDYDLTQHMNTSGKELKLYHEETKEKITPHVVCEPSIGVERALMVFLFDCFEDDKERGNKVLHLHPKLAPIKMAVFPLVKKEGIPEIAREIYRNLRSMYSCNYDAAGSVGRRYARNDEAGTPFCITVDFDSKDNNDVTVRDRDSTKQIRVPIDDLEMLFYKLIQKDMPFEQVMKDFTEVTK